MKSLGILGLGILGLSVLGQNDLRYLGLFGLEVLGWFRNSVRMGLLGAWAEKSLSFGLGPFRFKWDLV